jgi:hypothetical protein
MKTSGSVIFVLTTVFLFSCNEKFKEVSMDKFVGVWELKGRSIFDGIQIKIEKKDNKLNGRIVKLNDNKLVKMFSEVGDVWVSEIARSSNYQFKLTEKKIAKDLFSLYGMSTSQDFKIEFIDDNTIGLGTDSSDPQHATIIYTRVE